MPAIPVTNRKVERIEGREAVWARYPGFSLFCDNPGNSLAMLGCGLHEVACPLGEPRLEPYGPLAEGTRKVAAQEDGSGRDLLDYYGLCLLPSRPYHVAALDGMTLDAADELASLATRAALAQFAAELPGSLSDPHELATWMSASSLASLTAPIALQCDRLSTLGSTRVLVARLSAPRRSGTALGTMEAARSVLRAGTHGRFGVRHGLPDYKPHVTVGYFAHHRRRAGEERLECLDPNAEVRHWGRHDHVRDHLHAWFH